MTQQLQQAIRPRNSKSAKLQKLRRRRKRRDLWLQKQQFRQTKRRKPLRVSRWSPEAWPSKQRTKPAQLPRELRYRLRKPSRKPRQREPKRESFEKKYGECFPVSKLGYSRQKRKQPNQETE